MKIKLQNTKVYKWSEKNGISAIGYILKEEDFLTENQIIDFFKNVKSEQEILEKLKQIDGRFTVIIEQEEKVVIISDILRSFPIFYKIDKDDIFISNSIDNFENKILKENNVKEFLATGYTTGKDTIYEEIYQSESAQILIINKEKNEIKEEKYYTFKQEEDTIKIEDNKIFGELNKIYNNAIKRLITYANGRKIIVPLSGGHDSRIIAYYLKKNNYTNVLTYTYGRKDNEEAQVSKKVAEYLGYKWIFVEYKNKSMQKKFYNKKLYDEVSEYTGSAYSVPILQEWEAISEMNRLKILDGTEIIVPGYSGDFIAGSHIPQKIIENEKSNIADLKSEIIDKHYRLCGTYYDKHINLFWNKIEKNYNISNNKDYTIKELIDISEMFDFEERQAKFISNAVRIYEFYGLMWYMPLWDKEVMNFWTKIKYSDRYKRKLYIDFTMKEYPELMEYAPIVKEKSGRKSKNILEKLYRIYNIYYKHFLNYYGYLKISKYLSYCLRFKTINYYFMFADIYIKHIRDKEKKNEN